MSTKNNKIKKVAKETEEEIIKEELSPKELYDKKKEERLKEREKQLKKSNKTKKITKKKRKHILNLGTRILIVFMLLLMIASTVISIVAYL